MRVRVLETNFLSIQTQVGTDVNQPDSDNNSFFQRGTGTCLIIFTKLDDNLLEDQEWF